MRLSRIWFDRPGVRWRVVLPIVLVATGLVGLWISHQRELWTAEAVVAAAASAPVLSALPGVRSTPRPERVAVAVPASAPASRPAPVAARSMEVCGLGRVALNDGRGSEDPGAESLERRSRLLRERWLAAMQASADDRVRAAGWMIARAAGSEPPEILRDRLATLAASSRDPLVQAYALRACRGEVAESSACQALAPDNWARLEPDNAAAWLAVAADPRVDPAAQLDALQQAARGSRFDSHATELHALAQAAQPSGIGDLDRLTMAREVVAARADWLGTEALRQHCSAAALREPVRVPTCEAIADLLVTRAQTLPDLQQAREIGQRLGWPGERLDALRDETEALAALDRQRFDSPEAMSCTALARHSAYFADVGRLGEVGALRQAQQRAPR